MDELSRGRLAIKYIIFELLPIFFVGLAVFIFVLIMVQSFKLSEYVIVHGAQLSIIMKLLTYMMLGQLPTLLPIALLFSVLFVYGRLSGDSEIVALKALGLRPLHLVTPAIIVGIAVTIMSLQISFRLAPWGKKNLDELIHVLAQTKPGATIREGVFSQGFFNLVVYANKVDSRTGQLEKIFILDERDKKNPLTIISKRGKLFNTNTADGKAAYLSLYDGNLHKVGEEFYTKIDFKTYKINLFDAHDIEKRETDADGLNLRELKSAINDPTITGKPKINLILEWNKRWTLSMACIIFAILGVSLGAVTNKRAAKTGSMVICVGAIMIYWTLYATFESLARSEYLPITIASWMTNIIFLSFALQQFKRVRES